MFLKTEVRKKGPGRPLSLAGRMTLWYSLSAFALILIASGFLYRTLSNSLAHEDDVLLSQKFQNLTMRMKDPTVDLNDLQEFVGVLPMWYRNTSFWTRILDHQGRLLTETPGMSRVLPSGLFSNENSTIHSKEGRPFRVLSARGFWQGHNPSDLSIQMAFDTNFEETILASFRAKLLVAMVFSLLACALAGYWIAQRGVRPVRKMAATASLIRSSTLNERLGQAGLPAELSDLAGTFNGMLDRLEDSFNRLSRFSSDIAHELRTPLQTLRGEAEVVLSKERKPEEYREILGSSLEEFSRLSNLIDRLLFLARAENPKTQIQKEKLDLKKELELLHDFYGPSAGETGIHLGIETQDGLRVELDRSLFQRAVGNLVENALKHTPVGGNILLRTSNGQGKIRVEISDTGHGIPLDQLPRVFDRFYRVDASRTHSSGGAGLGLSIVKSIMDLHGGTVEILSEPSKGTVVTLLFPVKN